MNCETLYSFWYSFFLFFAIYPQLEKNYGKIYSYIFEFGVDNGIFLDTSDKILFSCDSIRLPTKEITLDIMWHSEDLVSHYLEHWDEMLEIEVV